MKIKSLYSALLMFSAVFLSTSVSAVPVTMTLENLLADQSTPYTEFGYTLEAPGSHMHNTFNLINFTNAAQLAADTTGMKLTKAGGGLFDLISLDAVNVLGLDATTGSFAIQIDGFAGGILKTSKQLLTGTSGVIDFLSGDALWGGVDEVRFWFESQPTGFGSFSTFAGDDFKFDNVLVQPSAVPLPAAVWLFFSAITGLGFMRKQQSVA
ncbi:MAG: hypothetical protein L3J75_04490 [Methylococcaceae bacterium]|nr:hypothetical protein [Methylococcaceae bacterium]